MDFVVRLDAQNVRALSEGRIEAVPLTKQICLCYSVAGLSTGIERWLTVLLQHADR